MIDLTKLQSTTQNQAFKNNDEFSGSFVIGGSFNTQTIQFAATINVPTGTDIADIMFQGRADGGFAFASGEPRPNAAWFKRGSVFVRADGDGLTNSPTAFLLSARIQGNTLIIIATSYKQFVANLYLTPETVQYKLVDYSVF